MNNGRRIVQDLLSDGKTPYERRLGKPVNGPVIPFGAMVEYHPISAKDISKLHQFGPKSLARYIPRLCIVCEENLERRDYDRRQWRIRADGRIRTPRPKTQCKGSVNANERRKFHIHSRRWNSQNFWRRSGSENIHNPGQQRQRRRTRYSSKRIRRVFFNLTTRLIMVWGWSQRRFWVYRRRFNLPSSRVKLYGLYQNYRHDVRCDVGEPEDHTRSWRSHCRKRYEFIRSLQSSAQIYSYASSNENTRWKGSSGKIVGKL